MRSSRPFCSAAALPDGDAGDDGRKIFVVGVNGSGAEIYDPMHDTWEDCGDGFAPASAPGLGSPLPHLRRDWAHPLPHLHRDRARPLPHLHRDWARPCHICAGTGLTRATSAPGLGSALPHLHCDSAQPCHICTGTGLCALSPAASAPGLGSAQPHLHRDRAHPIPHSHWDSIRLCHICTGTCIQ